MYESRRPEYYEAREAEWKPLATWGLLATIVVFFLAQMLVLTTFGRDLHRLIFVADMHWPFEPWTLITATLSHGGLFHLAVNGFVLFFFGPLLERLIGRTRFLVLFFVSGAVASVLQVYLSWFIYGQDPGGLGASGALMMIFGALMVVMPHERVLIWGIIPIPFWAAGIGFALLDILGALDPTSGVGNFAHLSGLAIGLYVGWRLRQDMHRRSLRFMRG